MNDLIQNINQNYDKIKKIIQNYNLLYKSYYFEHNYTKKQSLLISSFDDGELYKYDMHLDNSDRRTFFINNNLQLKLDNLKKNYLTNFTQILNIYSQICNCSLLFDDKWIKIKTENIIEYINSISGEDMQNRQFKLFLKELDKFADSFDITINIMSYELVEYDEDVDDRDKIFFCKIIIED
jgi:hypothetical protein